MPVAVVMVTANGMLASTETVFVTEIARPRVAMMLRSIEDAHYSTDKIIRTVDIALFSIA